MGPCVDTEIENKIPRFRDNRQGRETGSYAIELSIRTFAYF